MFQIVLKLALPAGGAAVQGAGNWDNAPLKPRKRSWAFSSALDRAFNEQSRIKPLPKRLAGELASWFQGRCPRSASRLRACPETDKAKHRKISNLEGRCHDVRRLVQAWSLEILSGSGSSAAAAAEAPKLPCLRATKGFRHAGNVLGSEIHHRPAPVELPWWRPPKGQSASATRREPDLNYLVETRRLLWQSLALVVHLQHRGHISASESHIQC